MCGEFFSIIFFYRVIVDIIKGLFLFPEVSTYLFLPRLEQRNSVIKVAFDT